MSSKISLDYVLGDFVSHPGKPDWGIGQVQSVDGARVTVTFEDGGKQVINVRLIDLHPVAPRTK